MYDMLTLEKISEIRAKGIDLSDIPEWTKEEFAAARFRNPEKAKAMLERFEECERNSPPDEKIDYSDAPPLTAKQIKEIA